MNRISLVTCLVLACSMAVALHAEPVPTQKRGTEFDADVVVEGDDVVVRVHATQRVPLAALAPMQPAPQREAQRLLLKGLETRLLGGSARDAAGLLAEASRLAPDDPAVAFWFATMLVDSGTGREAQRVVESHRSAIARDYPRAVDDLVRRIRQRVELERLPQEMLERIDRHNAAAALASPSAERRTAMVAFRIVDQHGAPVNQSDFRVYTDGGNQRVEEFTNGYFLVSFEQRRNQDDRAGRLEVNGMGIRTETHSLRSTIDRVTSAETFVVHRYRDEDKRSVTVVVVDVEDEPLTGVRVSLQPQRGGDPGARDDRTAETDDAGRAVLRAFPGDYSLTAAAEGYNAASASVKVADGAVEKQLTMHRVIKAAVRIRWLSLPLQGGPPGMDAVTTSEATLMVNHPGGSPHTPDMAWLRPVQVEDRIVLQMNVFMSYGPAMSAGGVWIKKYSADDAATAIERFDAIVLESVDDLPDDFQSVLPESDANRSHGGRVIPTPVKFGDVVVGRVMGRDMRSGGPALVTFKAIVERPEIPDAEDSD